MMKSFVFALLFTGFLCMGDLPAQAADEVDFGKLTCKELSATDAKDLPSLMMWCDGYMSAKSDNTVINQQWMEKLTTHMLTFCKANPGKTVINAMEAMPE